MTSPDTGSNPAALEAARKDTAAKLLAEVAEANEVAGSNKQLATALERAKARLADLLTLRESGNLTPQQAVDIMTLDNAKAEVSLQAAENDRVIDRETDFLNMKDFKERQMMEALMLAGQSGMDVSIAAVQLTGLDAITEQFGDPSFGLATAAGYLNNERRPILDFVGRDGDTIYMAFLGLKRDEKEQDLKAKREQDMPTTINLALEEIAQEIGLPLDTKNIKIGMHLGMTSLSDLALRPTADMDEAGRRDIMEKLMAAARVKLEEDKLPKPDTGAQPTPTTPAT